MRSAGDPLIILFADRKCTGSFGTTLLVLVQETWMDEGDASSPHDVEINCTTTIVQTASKVWNVVGR